MHAMLAQRTAAAPSTLAGVGARRSYAVVTRAQADNSNHLNKKIQKGTSDKVVGEWQLCGRFARGVA